jgi:hypothetical protein
MINKWNISKLLDNVSVNSYNGHLNNNLSLIVINLLKEFKMSIIKNKKSNKFKAPSISCTFAIIHRD